MFRSIVMSGIVMAATLLPPTARADVTLAEFGCEYKTSILLWKFYAAKSKCIVSCQLEARAGKHSVADCVPPFAQSTQGCVNGLSGKTKAKFCKSCNNSHPTCYGSGPCPGTISDSKIDDIENNVVDDLIVSDDYCDDSGSGDGLTEAEGACQDTVAIYLAKFAYGKAKCLAKCKRYEFRQAIPAGSCTPGSITDPSGKTQACLQKLADKYTVPACADAPECHTRSGSQWNDAVESAIDDRQDDIYCASPSGAFLGN